MELYEVKEILHAGLARDNWTDDQQIAIREALKCVYKIEKIQEEAQELYIEQINLSDFGERVSNII